MADTGPAPYSWNIIPGDNESRTFEFEDETGQEITLVGPFRAEFRKARDEDDDVDPSATASCSVHDTNKVTVTLTSTQTRALKDLGYRRYFWDLQDDGTETTLVTGQAVVGSDVTR